MRSDPVDTAHGDREFLLLWPGGAPGAVGAEPQDKSKITIYRAPAKSANGAAAVVCPGGGYRTLASDHVGKQVAEWASPRSCSSTDWGRATAIQHPCSTCSARSGSCARARLFPETTAGSGAYAMVGMAGMAAFFAAAAKAPMTSILILFEMTNDYRIILPLMTATVAGVYISHAYLPHSIYMLKLQRRGIGFPQFDSTRDCRRGRLGR